MPKAIGPRDRVPSLPIRYGGPRLVIVAVTALFLTMQTGFSPAMAANPLRIQVVDSGGKPLADAVVTLVPLGDTQERGEPDAAGEAVLAQRDHRFVPFVMAIPVGTRVHFPNFDDTRHHVYSFSAVRPFEIQLYRGDPEVTIDFPKAGVAVVGCNIHDWMEAYIFVTEAPLYAVTSEEGQVTFEAAPTGRFEARAWHPWQQGEDDTWVGDRQSLGDSGLSLELDLALPPPRRPAENALKQWIQNQ